MRGLLLVLLAGCAISPGDPGEGRFGAACRTDAGCPTGDVCARNGVCMASTSVRTVHVMWTVSGRIADEATCSPHPDLQIDFHSSSGLTHVSYAPVPCIAGKFSVDKLPASCELVELGPTHTQDAWRSGRLDAVTGETTLDLPF